MTKTATCAMRSCNNEATPKPVWDANPNPAERKVIGEVAICDEHQAKIDAVNKG